MKWIRSHWKRVAKYVGIALACLVVALGAFVLARYISAGATYDGRLLDLAPAEVSVVLRIDSVPTRLLEIESLVNHLADQPRLASLESSALWENTLGGTIGSVRELRDERWEQAMRRARGSTQQLGATLFDDVLGGELILCSDPGEGNEFVALSRVARNVRFRWKFLDVASAFFPDGPYQPRLEYSGGILRLTPAQSPGGPLAEPFLITLLDDVLVIANSARLINATIQLHASGARGAAGSEAYVETIALVDERSASRYVGGLWIDLDRLRRRLPVKRLPDGTTLSPVDTIQSLPPEVRGIYPDIFVPLDLMLSRNLDTTPFRAAYYGLDIGDPSTLRFDQYLLVAKDRLAQDSYRHLRRTWSYPAATASQLDVLPPDTMFQVSFRQPVNVLHEDVFDDSARASLVGDFIVALQGSGVRRHMQGGVDEIAFCLLPRSYAPATRAPGLAFPVPALALMFRARGAEPEVARILMEDYLLAQRGRERDDDDVDVQTGPFRVVPKRLGNHQIYAFEGEGTAIAEFIRTLRGALVGEWIVLTNSESYLSQALSRQLSGGLSSHVGSAWRLIPTEGSASLYLNFEQFAAFAGAPDIVGELRSNRYNPALIEGRSPGEVRAEIAAQVGTDDLAHPEVARIYRERDAEWRRICEVEGAAYERSLRATFDGLRLFRDLALMTTFADDHLRVQGVLRIGG